MRKFARSQSGMTLVISLIMLIVLTLLVVSAIRFGNINLKIATNTQAEAEAAAAAQVALEQMLKQIDAADDIASVSAMTNANISTGGTTYKVNVTKPSCNLTSYVQSTELDPSNSVDRLCFGGGGSEVIFDKDGKPVAQPTECKSQIWETQASVSDSGSGANVTMVQGISVRVSVEQSCS